MLSRDKWGLILRPKDPNLNYTLFECGLIEIGFLQLRKYYIVDGTELLAMATSILHIDPFLNQFESIKSLNLYAINHKLLYVYQHIFYKYIIKIIIIW